MNWLGNIWSRKTGGSCKRSAATRNYIRQPSRGRTARSQIHFAGDCDMSEHQSVFKAVLARYYKAERDRSEECLWDIIKVLQDETTSEGEQVDKILERLVTHYSDR
jgi:hypothetical protein